MPELARMVTTDAEIDAAIEQARRLEKYDRRVLRAAYSEGADAIVLLMEKGVSFSVPRRLLQGLTEAKAEDVSQIELLGRGTGLYWPSLDVAHSVSGLLAGIYGSARWMERLQLESESDRIPA
jgi:hypothetical protein